MPENRFRSLPSVGRIINDRRLRSRRTGGLLAPIAREVLAAARESVASGRVAPTYDALVDQVDRRAASLLAPPLRSLINATGVIIHTNLGRVPLAEEAIAAMATVSRGYSNLELDIGPGARGSRHTMLEPLLRALTGGDAAMAVNNNASALLLALSALASGHEVVLSRGQSVEIGGGFRIPDVMRQSRARLVDVGTTNRTTVDDYACAIGPKTVALMRVHPSNFRVVGFTGAPALADIARVAHDAGVVLIDDIGSGCLLNTSRYGLAAEPTPAASIADGADLVLFSGDKLLGGPQGGLIVGRADLVTRLKKHPLARAVRLDKSSIAGLAATLLIYLRGEAEEKIPVWQMIAMPLDVIAARAEQLASASAAARAVDSRSMIGGGSLPGESLPTRAVALEPRRPGASTVARRLRARGIIARVEDERVLLDPRTIAPGEDESVAAAIRDVLA